MGRWYDTETETELTTRAALRGEEIPKKIEKVIARALQRFKLERDGSPNLQVVEVKTEHPKELMMIHTYKQFQVVARIDLERGLPDLGAGPRHLVWIGVRRI